MWQYKFYQIKNIYVFKIAIIEDAVIIGFSDYIHICN